MVKHKPEKLLIINHQIKPSNYIILINIKVIQQIEDLGFIQFYLHLICLIPNIVIYGQIQG